MILRSYQKRAAWTVGRWSRCQDSYSSVQQPSSCGKLSDNHFGICFLIRSPTLPQSHLPFGANVSLAMTASGMASQTA
jgi:hypothetical protein